MCFGQDWLAEVQKQAGEPRPKPQLICNPPPADVAVSLALEAGRVVGVVENRGPSTANQVRIDVEGSSVVFLSAQATQGSVTAAGSQVGWDVGSLPAGSTATLTMEIDIDGDWSATATAQATESDPDTTNNSSTIRIIA